MLQSKSHSAGSTRETFRLVAKACHTFGETAARDPASNLGVDFENYRIFIDQPPIINVDDQGLDADGLGYVYEPTLRAVEQDLVTSRLVVLRYPDGRLDEATEVPITKKDLAQLTANPPSVEVIDNLRGIV
ncbi:hypothetical protein [Methylobacterium nodulans]|uniref:Uncharacterized protein n=1 Tax=Methylobacterium nodulans (strain LMG 21967 / CNCM I-2342 / ORS 2060) TaxID=460265 RepID=B8IT75_METNO|nr:hypothetical protein [Methylobacterium nodulans]ACL56961.1 hypothetical protein Mnod_1973 [Methylobacterium nodulans ORS 2060]